MKNSASIIFASIVILIATLDIRAHKKEIHQDLASYAMTCAENARGGVWLSSTYRNLILGALTGP